MFSLLLCIRIFYTVTVSSTLAQYYFCWTWRTQKKINGNATRPCSDQSPNFLSAPSHAMVRFWTKDATRLWASPRVRAAIERNWVPNRLHFGQGQGVNKARQNNALELLHWKEGRKSNIPWISINLAWFYNIYFMYVECAKFTLFSSIIYLDKLQYTKADLFNSGRNFELCEICQLAQ